MWYGTCRFGGKKEENEHKVRQLLTYIVPRLQLIYTYHKRNLSVALATKSFNTAILKTKLKLKEMKQKMKPYLLNKMKKRIVFFFCGYNWTISFRFNNIRHWKKEYSI